MIALPKLRNLKILSLGRNNIKKLQGLDEIGRTLEELWISYNQIEKLDGLQNCVSLITMFINNNLIRDWSEVAKLQQLPEIKNVTLRGNPVYGDDKTLEVIPKVIIRVPQLDSLDGKMITAAMRSDAEAQIDNEEEE